MNEVQFSYAVGLNQSSNLPIFSNFLGINRQLQNVFHEKILTWLIDWVFMEIQYVYSHIDNVCYIIILTKVEKSLIIHNETNHRSESSTKVNKWSMHKLTENRWLVRNWCFICKSVFWILALCNNYAVYRSFDCKCWTLTFIIVNI